MSLVLPVALLFSTDTSHSQALLADLEYSDAGVACVTLVVVTMPGIQLLGAYQKLGLQAYEADHCEVSKISQAGPNGQRRSSGHLEDFKIACFGSFVVLEHVEPRPRNRFFKIFCSIALKIFLQKTSFFIGTLL